MADARLDQLCMNTIRTLSFGASAPLRELQKRFGFTPEAVAAAARAQVARAATGR